MGFMKWLHKCYMMRQQQELIYVRLENLQEITEIYGKKESNEILLCMKSVFEKFEQEKHVLGRLGGSDFCLLLEDKMQEEIEVLA